jgi:hypothetical protein
VYLRVTFENISMPLEESARTYDWKLKEVKRMAIDAFPMRTLCKAEPNYLVFNIGPDKFITVEAPFFIAKDKINVMIEEILNYHLKEGIGNSKNDNKTKNQ